MLDRLLFLRHLEPDEELKKIVHKHWIIMLLAVFWPSTSLLLGMFTLTLLPYRPIVLLTGCWAIFSIVWWIRNFFDEYLDAWIVTDTAIINIEWFGWFHRKSTRILYSDIEGVSYEIQGILATLLHYGTLSLERVSTGAVVDLDYVPRPREMEGNILRNMEAYLHTKNLKDATHVQELLSEIVARHLQLDDGVAEDTLEEDAVEHSVS